jgi:2-polyprenyl-6-methoxyphenol hydroxylase-like FAD-dependent oxidoreductase
VTEAPILVVGAGPTGLSAAVELARREVPVRVVDREPGPVEESRALVVQPRSLEIWLDQGLADRAFEHGLPVRAADIRLEGGDPVHVDLTGMGGPFDAPLVLPQDRTEAALVDRLAELGVEVERETELEHLNQLQGTPEATLAGPDGTERVEASWIVGADGAHSTVRDELGLPFEGAGYPERFAVADLDADTELATGVIHGAIHQGDLLLIVPLRRPGHFRITTTHRPGDGADPDDPPTRAELQRLVHDHLAEPMELAEPRWRSVFRVHCRGVPRYRDGRVLLAGDAAHIHSPAGGQGMNTGIQDAHNLGWKLGLVHDELASPDLLDSYDAERHRVGERLLQTTDRLFGLARAAIPGTRLLRRWIARPLLARDRVQARLRDFVSQRSIRYRDSPIVGAPRQAQDPQPGDQLPDQPVVHDGEEEHLLSVLAGREHHVVLIVEGTEPSSSPSQRQRFRDELTDRWPGLIADAWTILHGPPPPDEPALVDPHGDLHEALARGKPGYEVVRPDGYLAVRADGFDPGRLDAYVERLARA